MFHVECHCHTLNMSEEYFNNSNLYRVLNNNIRIYIYTDKSVPYFGDYLHILHAYIHSLTHTYTQIHTDMYSGL